MCVGTFNYVADIIEDFVQGWSKNLLSCPGREVLIKANAQGVPTYTMICFKLIANVWKKMQFLTSSGGVQFIDIKSIGSMGQS